MKDGEGFAACGEVLRLGIGPGQVGNEGAMFTEIGAEEHGQMAGEWRNTVIRDERGEAVFAQKRGKPDFVLNTKRRRDIHGKTSCKWMREPQDPATYFASTSR
jgi:hypothetical protein